MIFVCSTNWGNSNRVSTPRTSRPAGAAELQREFAFVDDAGGAAGGVFDAADDVELFAAALEFGFGVRDVAARDNENHADAEIEGAQHLVAVHIADFCEVAKDRQHGPGAELNDGLDVAGQRARKIAGDAAAGDVSHRRGPSMRQNVFQERPVGTMRP